MKVSEKAIVLFQETDLIRPLNTEKKKRGFQKVSDQDRRNAYIRFLLRDQDLKFINEFCEFYAMTKTEFILRSIQCYTGYNGRNAKSVMTRQKKLNGHL